MCKRISAIYRAQSNFSVTTQIAIDSHRVHRDTKRFVGFIRFVEFIEFPANPINSITP